MLQLVTCFCFFAILVLVWIRTWFLELERSHLNPDEISLAHYNLMAPTFWLLDPALRKMVSFVFSLLSFPLKFCFSISVDLFFVLSLCCGLLLASSMAESCCCFQTCSRNGSQVGVFHWPLPTVGLFFVFFLVFPILDLCVASWRSVHLAVGFFFIMRMEISLFLWKIFKEDEEPTWNQLCKYALKGEVYEQRVFE